MNAFGSIDSPFFFFCYSSNTNSYRKIKKGSWPRIYIEFGALRWSGAWQMSGSALCYEQYTLYCRLKQFRIATVWTFNPRSAESINHIIFDADGNIAVISSPTSPLVSFSMQPCPFIALTQHLHTNHPIIQNYFGDEEHIDR